MHERTEDFEARQSKLVVEARHMRFKFSAVQHKGAVIITNARECDLCGRQRFSRIGLHSQKLRRSNRSTT